MRPKRSQAKSRLVPTLRYHDPTAAIKWLCAAFGFQEHRIVAAEDGTIRYAQLTFGDDMMVLSPARRSAGDDDAKVPRQGLSGASQSCYFVVDDIDRHYRCAEAQGAGILDDLGDYDFIGRGYSCRDPEGQVWSFGTRDPREWEPEGVTRRSSGAATLGRRLGVRVSIAAIAATTTAWMFVALPQFPSSGTEKSISVIGQQRADEGTVRVVLKTAEPVDLRELASETTAAPLRAIADGERAPDAATELSRMKDPPFSVIQHDEAMALKPPQPAVGKDIAQHAEGDALKQPARDQVAQQPQIRETILDTNSAPPSSERSTPQPPKRRAEAQFWECLPRPPTGNVVCRPITRRSKQ